MRSKIEMIKQKFVWDILAVLLVILMSGCYGNKTAQEVAKHFWNAIKAQDIENARRYSTMTSRNSIDLSDWSFSVTVVTFGKILIDGDKTTIETTMQIQKNDSEETIPLQTILNNENEVWRVDYLQTKSTFNVSNAFCEMLNNMRGFGKELTENVDKSLEELKQKIPEIEKKLKELGTAASEKIQEAWQQHMPEIKKKVEELGKALEEVLRSEEGNNSKQEEPQTNQLPENSITF